MARAIALELRSVGTEHFFLVTGGDNSIWIALHAEGIRQVLARSEASAVYMADAYARVRGQPSFVYGQYGPGASNVAGALAEPYWACSPVVALPTAMRRQHRFRREYQELDQPRLFSAVTKWQAEASVASQVPRLLRTATRVAVSGTPGPTYLGIPSDVLEEEIPDFDEPAGPVRPLTIPLVRPAPAESDAELAAEALLRASRPIILAGSGVHLSGAHESLREVAERLEVPVATSLAGKGAIPESHALAVGSVGRYSRNYANAALRDADVIMAIGTQLGGLVTDSYRLIQPGAKLIHVTLDAEAIGSNFPTELGIVADAKSFLDALLQALADKDSLPSRKRKSAPVLAQLRAAWEERRAALAQQDGSDGRPMRPEALMVALGEQLPDDSIVVADTGYAAAWAGALLELPRAGRNFLRADGSLGWAFPASLGAQLAAPDRPVVCITGDGGFGYHVGDIETALRLGLPVIVVVLDNQTLAFEAHVQAQLYGTLVPEVDDFRDVDYARVAEAFGARAARVTSVSEMRAALVQGLERRMPMLIDAVIDRDAIGPVTRYDRVREREL